VTVDSTDGGLRALITEAEERAAAAERERLARDLHDGVIAALYSISLGATAAGELIRQDPEGAERSIAMIQRTALDGLTDLRGLVLRLLPDPVPASPAGQPPDAPDAPDGQPDAGLTGMLVRLLDQVRDLHGCRATAEIAAEPPADPAVRQAMYRITQEAVQNAAKHAAADEVTIRVSADEERAVLEIIDNGRGFTAGQNRAGGLGLHSMRTRAERAGGRLQVLSTPGSGTVIRAILPTRPAPPLPR
jgi:signal transduction histidine kinase